MTMTMKMTMTMTTMTIKRMKISRRWKPKSSRRQRVAGRGEGTRPEGAARRLPLRLRTMAEARVAPQTTKTATRNTKTSRAAAAERMIATRKQEEHEEEAEIVGQFFLSTPVPPPTTTTPACASPFLCLDRPQIRMF